MVKKLFLIVDKKFFPQITFSFDYPSPVLVISICIIEVHERLENDFIRMDEEK